MIANCNRPHVLYSRLCQTFNIHKIVIHIQETKDNAYDNARLQDESFFVRYGECVQSKPCPFSSITAVNHLNASASKMCETPRI